MHLILDGYGGDPTKLQDLKFIYELLDYYPAHIGMNKIMPPYVFRYRGEKEQDWGVSGFVLIAESHISIHTFPERGYVNIDIFSCKEFDSQGAIQHLWKEFDLERVSTRVLARGLEYPTDPDSATELVRMERLELVGTYPELAEGACPELAEGKARSHHP